jgi:hypothetical protein
LEQPLSHITQGLAIEIIPDNRCSHFPQVYEDKVEQKVTRSSNRHDQFTDSYISRKMLDDLLLYLFEQLVLRLIPMHSSAPWSRVKA